MEIKILYEDKDLILAQKPVGLSSQPSNTEGRCELPDELSLYRTQKGESAYIGLVHRLDTTTGGVILYSKQQALTGKLSEMVAQKEYKKIYLCVVHSRPEQDVGEMHDLLFHDKGKNKTYVVKKERRGVKVAKLRYEVLESVALPSGEVCSLCRVELITGRTHQIRSQFAGRKMPLLGDGKYGSRDNGCSCALWSHRAEFKHPRTDNNIEVTSYPPNVYPWSLFDITRSEKS